jgi:hypothetical protein
MVTKTKKVQNPLTGKTYTIKSRSNVYSEAGSIRGLWAHKSNKFSSEGDYNYDGQGIKRGNVQCKKCRGGEDQRYKCSLIRATPVCGCPY